MSTFVSIIVPVYNTEQYVERCINSILAQTYRNFELIIVDDGSTDKCVEIIDEYAKKDERIRVFHKENGGSSSARNHALDNAKGEYVSFVDSDDYIEPDFIESLVAPINRAMEKGKKAPSIVQIGRDEIDENGNQLPIICTAPENETFIDSRSFYEELLLHRGDCSFCTKLTLRKLFEDLRFPAGKLNEDFGLLICFLKKCDGIVSLPGYKYHVFYRLGSNTRKIEKNNFSRVFKDNVENADKVYDIILEKFPDLEPVALRFGLFQRLDYLLHIPIIYMNKDYEGYPEIVSYVRKNLLKAWGSKYLTGKNKLYLTIFAIAPKLSRVVHSKIKRL